MCKTTLLSEYKKGNSELEFKNDNGETPLIATIAKNHYVAIKMLVEARANVDVRDRYGEHVFMYAIRHKRYNISSLLLKSKNVINSTDVKGNTSLMAATNEGDEESVVYLLDNGADTSCKNWTKHTALSLALKNRHDRIVSLLTRKRS